MIKPNLNSNGEFVVAESRFSNFVIAAAFLAMSISAIFVPLFPLANGFLCIVFLLISIGHLRTGIARNVHIKINERGIFYSGKLVTDWDNFLSAKISQKTVNGSLRDNFILLLVYTKYDKPGQFRRTIDLTNTQDKGEEEVIATIRYFYTLSNALETKTE